MLWKLDHTFKQILKDGRVKGLNIKNNEKELLLFLILANHWSTDHMSFCWFTNVFDWNMLLMLSKIALPILLILDFKGLTKWQELLLGKYSLRYLIVAYALVSCILSYQRLNVFLWFFFEVRLMLKSFLRADFLQALETIFLFTLYILLIVTYKCF